MEAVSRTRYPVYSPSNMEMIAEVPDMGPDDAQLAIKEAHSSQKAWASLTSKERAAALRRWHDLIVQNKDDIARTVTLEMGKPYAESKIEVLYGAAYTEWFAEEAKRIYGDVIPPFVNDRRLLVIKQPVGVAALVTPWNFPVAMMLRKVAPALAAGCTTVVKPSDESPLSVLELAKLSHEAGIPPGVFNVLTASRESTPALVQALTSSELVAKLSFTGSTAIGKVLMSQCSQTIKRISLELGGNAPLIVFNSADVKVAVRGAIASKFRNTGQTCICPNRLLVQSGIHDEFVEKLSEAVSQLRIGDPFEEGMQQGPLVNQMAVEKVERHVSDATSKGSEVVVGGTRREDLGGWYYQPSVLTKVNTDMLFSREETFGPVAPIIRFEDEEEAIALANATTYGLAGYCFTRDPSQIWRVSEGLETGIVGVNEGAISSEVVPFGGIKQSGIGREGSKYGINDYLNLKYICMGNIEQ